MSSAGPLVSVSIPTYNQQDFIGAALDAVFSQDYECLQVVVGDDCSSDNTWAIVLEYAARFPDKIIAFRNERNLGVTGNCNEILRHCTGKYVAFYAGDDLYLPGKLRKQVDAMENDPSSVLCYHDIEVFESSTDQRLRFWNHGPSSFVPFAGLASEVARRVVAKGTFMAALSVMVRRDAMPGAGFDRRIPVASDWMFWIDVLANAPHEATVVFLDEVLARYRRHTSNVTSNADGNRSDVLVTLALVESKYPWLINEVANYQAAQRYNQGVRLIREGQFAAGRRNLLQSGRVKVFSWKLFAWLVVSYVQVLPTSK